MIAVAVTTTLVLTVFSVVALRSRQHKRHQSAGSLLNTTAIVDSPLAPEGAVLIHGELWLARTVDGAFVPARARVTVVGTQGHLLLVS